MADFFQLSSSKAYKEAYGILAGYFNNDFTDNYLLSIMNDHAGSGADSSWGYFDRFYTVNLEHQAPSNRHYIFICRPDLHLAEEGDTVLSTASGVSADPYFRYLASYHPEIISSLTGDFAGMKSIMETKEPAATGSGYGNSKFTDGSKLKFNNGSSVDLTMHVFMPTITHRVESLQIPDYTIKQNVIVQPYTRYSMPYTSSAIESTTGGSFDLVLREDRYLSMHKMFYAWVYYQHNVMKNIFRPKDKYMLYNALDYATSIYDFLVDETGENIIYWAKYTGCVPTGAPMSDLSFNKGGEAETKVTIPFSYFMCEHMDLDILVDFQYNSLGYIVAKNTFASTSNSKGSLLNPNVVTKPIYRSSTFLGENFASRPIIQYGVPDESGKRHIKLKWID